VLYFLWFFNTLSCIVGCLQILYPGQFTMEISLVTKSIGELTDGLKLTLADGSQVWRPTGLTDVPGGAAPAGLAAILLSIGVFTSTKNLYLRSLCVPSICAGLFCIFLCQVRVVVVIMTVEVIAFSIGLLVLKRYWEFLVLSVILSALGAGMYFVSADYGGDTMTKRLETLVEDSPGAVYYSNRGRFLDYTIDELFDKYPLGAGLGRWGMMNSYFGTPDELWVEIQWTAWVYDGGLPLLFLSVSALACALVSSIRIAYYAFEDNNQWLTAWGVLIVAYNIGTVAFLFSYAPFIGQAGLEFWMLNAMLYTLAHHERKLKQ
jgi:hypothetical protein